MGEVYSNALLNIGASHARNPDQGLFHKRASNRFKTTNIQWRPTAHGKQYPYRISCHRFDPLGEVFSSLRNCSLMDRGWIVQETVISKRMLSFNGPTVFWQCAEFAACEDYPNDRTYSVEGIAGHSFWALTDPKDLLRQLRPLHHGVQDQQSDPEGENSKPSIHERWFDLTLQYCWAKLSFPDKDKFAALEGVGQRISQITGDLYQHGLFRYTLPLILLCTLPCGSLGAPPERGATWHWASYDNMMFHYPRALCENQRLNREKYSNLASSRDSTIARKYHGQAQRQRKIDTLSSTLPTFIPKASPISPHRKRPPTLSKQCQKPPSSISLPPHSYSQRTLTAVAKRRE